VIRLRVNAEGTKRALRRAGERFVAEVERGMRQSGEEFIREMQTTRFRGYSGEKGDLLQSRTGSLAGSFSYDVRNLRLVLFSQGLKYARLQELGGTIRPKPPKRFLTIPGPDNLTAAGVARFPSAAALRSVTGATFVFRTPKGDLWIGARPRDFESAHYASGTPNQRLPRDAKRGHSADSLRFLWRLVPSVTIPPRLGMVATFRRLRTKRAARLREAVRAALRGA
jgi:phage gpG-like protein